MDIITLCIYNAEICFEESISQNFDEGHSFGFMMYRRRELGKKMTKNGKSYPFFVIKSKPEPKQQIWDTLP